MAKDDLHKLGKTELLEIIYNQQRELNKLKEENKELNEEIDNRKIELEKARFNC